MISSLDDLARYTQERARQAPLIADRIVLRSPGLAQSEFACLADALPGLSEDYLDCLARIDLQGISIGYFSFPPPRTPGGPGLVEWLRDANSDAEIDSNPVSHFLAANELYEVASFESDPICMVRTTARERSGQVVWVDIETGPEIMAHPVALSFERFLIAAGRLSQAGHDPTIVGPAATEQFIARLDDLGFDERQRESWRLLADMSLPS